MPHPDRAALVRLLKTVLGDSLYARLKSRYLALKYYPLKYNVLHPLRAVSTPIVVDLGCYAHPGQDSIRPLVERFRPSVLYGFDPLLSLRERESVLQGSRVVLSPRAAWLHDGEVEFRAGKGHYRDASTVMRERDDQGEWGTGFDGLKVPCFDLAGWLEGLPKAKLVVKMDVEGAEYPLLERMIDRGVDSRVSVLLIEWHEFDGSQGRRAEILRRLRCGRVRQWHGADSPA
jgi:FkbM family methyltransferase